VCIDKRFTFLLQELELLKKEKDEALAEETRNTKAGEIDREDEH
jgi:hypothetical protein